MLSRRTLLQLAALQQQSPAGRLIRNATLVNGAGAPARPGDLLVRDGRIAALGELENVSARRTIEARGLVLAPGFIGEHNHSDETLIDDPQCEAMVRQGVTTMVLGEGNSAGPIPAGLREWSTLGGYVDFLAGRGVATNICSCLGQTQIWIHVQGKALTPATPSELERMKEEVARDEGLDVRANVYPCTAGQNNLRAIIPPWAHDGGNAKMLERLRNPALRPRLKREIREGLPNWYNHYLVTGGGWAGMLLVTLKSPQYAGFTGKRISELIAAQKSQDGVDVLFDVLPGENGSVPCVFFHHAEDGMTHALRQPYTSIGSDGAAIAFDGPAKSTHPHPRWYGAFPL